MNSSLSDLLHEFIRQKDEHEECDESAIIQDVMKYLRDLHNRLALTWKNANERASNMQAKAKRNYDTANKETVNRQFTENDRVLVLIPDDSRKLYAR